MKSHRLENQMNDLNNKVKNLEVIAAENQAKKQEGKHVGCSGK